MKRGMLNLLAVIIICAILCGCGAASQVTESNEKPEEHTFTEKLDGTASASEEDTAPETEMDADAPDSEAEADFLKSVYHELLDEIYALILSEDKQTDMELAAQAVNGILDAGYSAYPEETLEHVGYALRDFNADGVPELVIGGISEEADGKYFGRDIYAVYTCVQDEIYCICSGWARSYVGWMGENVFYYSGSGGAMYTMVGQYELLPNAAEWSCVDFYFTDENGIYHNQTGIESAEHSEMLDMTWDELWELDDELYDNVQELELTQFSDWT